MNPLLTTLLNRAPVILDGAWGTQLQAEGLRMGEPPELWNIDHPETVSSIAHAYAEAGSQVVLTNTFGANRISLKKFGLDSRSAELNRLGVLLSRRGAGDRAKVFASMGPSGRLIINGDVTAENLREAFAAQAQELAAASADALVVETMSDLDEARIAVQAAHATGLPVVACMSFDSGKNRDRTMMGVTPELAVRELTEAGADVLGANCGQGVEGYVSLCERLRNSTSLPLWIKPNAGLPELHEGRAIYRQTPDHFASFVASLVRAGASFIGGCCGTNPAFIRAMREVVA